ncbi:MAG: transposase [Flavonifractor plautii]
MTAASAITILSEIGIDMTQFGSSKRLCCWAGLTPGNNESAGKKNLSAFHVREYISNLRWCKSPTQTVKDKASPYYVLKYERIAKRRGKKRAIIAIARMILTAVYVMLSNLEEWNPVDLYKVDMPEHLKEKQLAKAVKQAVRFLEAQGLTVLDSA